MKKYIIYVCEYCDRHYTSEEDSLICEASHIGNGLSPKEYEYYNAAKYFINIWKEKDFSHTDSKVKKEIDRINGEYEQFKKDHNILE